MARILLIEDVLDIGAYEAHLLEERGHEVWLCRGAPTPFGRCPLLSGGRCALADGADLILFSYALHAPLGLQPEHGMDLLHAYRTDPAHSAKPCVVVSLEPVKDLPGSGSVTHVCKFSPARLVVDAVEQALRVSKGESDVGKGRYDTRRDVDRSGHALQGDRGPAGRARHHRRSGRRGRKGRGDRDAV